MDIQSIQLPYTRRAVSGPLDIFACLSVISPFHKLKATALKAALRKYGISSFVAHEDIEPTFEWQDEIEKALASMDALTAILIPGFHDSNWTDQEIGYALGRGVLVLPLRNGLDPYGFVGKFQGIPCHDRTVAQVAKSVFQALVSNAATKNKIATALVDLTVGAVDPATGLQFLGSLKQIGDLPQSHLEKLRDNIGENDRLVSDTKFLDELNRSLKERDLSQYEIPKSANFMDDEIPF